MGISVAVLLCAVRRGGMKQPLATRQTTVSSILTCDNFSIADIRNAVTAVASTIRRKPTAHMTAIPDPRVHARFYFKAMPTHAIAVDEPWWWPVLALGSGLINVHFQSNYRGPLAIVSRGQTPWHRNQDVQAIEAILRAEGRPAFDAYSCPMAAEKIVGLVNVLDCVEEPPEPSSWFVGPFALIVDQPCLLPIGHAGGLYSSQGLIPVDQPKQSGITYALTAMANGHLKPGAERRR